jgi:hypothetical protein
VTAAIPITCAPCKAGLAARGPRNLMTTSTAGTETSVSTPNMAGRGMSSDSMPTSVTAVSTMTPAMTSTGIHWRRNCQKSCHHQRSKR